MARPRDRPCNGDTARPVQHGLRSVRQRRPSRGQPLNDLGRPPGSRDRLPDDDVVGGRPGDGDAAPEDRGAGIPTLLLPIVAVPQVEPRSVDTRAFTVPALSAIHVTTTVEPSAATKGRPPGPPKWRWRGPDRVFVQFAPRSLTRDPDLTVVPSVYAMYTSRR